MSSILVLVRLAARHVGPARRDERYAVGLLSGRADDVTDDESIEVLDLPRDLHRVVIPPDPASELILFALKGYVEGGGVAGLSSAWLCHGFDTGYGWPAVIEASSVVRLAFALPGAIAGRGPGAPIDERRARDLAALAAFYRRAADAGQVVIVAEV